MVIEILVPDLGESVIEATVVKWLKQEGDQVVVDEPILVLETDKVDVEVSTATAGVLAKIEKQVGTDVKVGDILGIIQETSAAMLPEMPMEQSILSPTPHPQQTSNQVSEPQEKITPVAKRMAEDLKVDVTQVKSSSGRVTKKDVEQYIAAQEPVLPSDASPSVPVGQEREARIKMSRRRRTIAQRLVEAQHTAAMLTTFNEINMTAVMDIRQRHKESFKQRHGIGLGLSSFFVKATIAALKHFPRLNAEIQGDEIILKHYYNIGIAIGATDGLVVPVLQDADRLSFAEIEQAIKAFAQKSETGTLTLDDLRGGTFTITNGGVFGSMLSTPILNAPEVAILGLHKIEPRPIALNNEVVIQQMMYVALSYDHRIVDGREAVQFLTRIKELIEDPEFLLLER